MYNPLLPDLSTLKNEDLDNKITESMQKYFSPNIYFNPNSQNIIEFYKQNLNIEDCKYIKCNFMGTQIDYPSNFDNFGDDYVRSVFNYFKRIKGHSYDLPRLSSGEILYKKLTGFTFDLNPGII
jgi:hypothetical protein